MPLKPQPQQPYLVIAADPEANWRLHRIDIDDAVSPDHARDLARAELATLRRDHWSIRLVRERRAA